MPRALPSGKFQARHYEKDTRTQVALGTYNTAEEAEKAEVRYAVQVEMGLVPTKGDTAKPVRVRGREPFGAYAERKLELRRQKLKRTTYHTYSFNLHAHLLPTFGHMALADITQEDVEAWWNSMEGKPHARRKGYATLSYTLKRAVRDGAIRANPCNIEGATSDVSTKRPTFGMREFLWLHDMAPDAQMKAQLWVLIGTGCRAGEMLALTWADVDLDNARITVDKHLTQYGLIDGTKSHDDGRRVLALPPQAVETLRTLYNERHPMEDDPCWITAWGLRQSYNTFCYHFCRLKNLLELGALRVHDLRHVHLTEYAKYSTQAELMAHAGHTDHRSSMRYQHPDDERQMEIVSRMAFS